MSTSDPSPPSYDSIVDSADNTYQYSQPQTHIRLDEHLHTQITTFRADHVQELTSKFLLPIVQARVRKGLSRTSIALLPFDVTSGTTSSSSTDTKSEDSLPALKVIDIVSSHDDDLQQVQLTNHIDTSAFWAQPAVLRELRHCLKTRLTSAVETAKTAVKPQLETQPAPVPVPAPTQPQQTQSKSRNFFTRRISSNKSQRKESSTPQDSTKGSPSDSSSLELVAVDIRPDEVCMRTVTDFGLYQTLTRQAVIVRIIIRA